MKTATKNISISLFLMVVLLGSFGEIMVHPVNHDENMYLASGILLMTNEIYTDYAYLQMPYLPLLYYSVFFYCGNNYYLLVGRIIEFISISLSAFLIYSILLLLSRSHLVSTLGFLLFVFNEIVRQTMTLARNHDIPLTLTLAAVFLFLYQDKLKKKPLFYMFLTGFFLGLAVGFKLTYALFPAAFTVTALIFPKENTIKQKVIHKIIPIFSGVILGLLPAGYYIFKTVVSRIFRTFCERYSEHRSWRWFNRPVVPGPFPPNVSY